MAENKWSRLPRGIHWVSNPPYIWFSWRDAGRKQHHQPTRTAGPAQALLFKINFFQNLKRNQEDVGWLVPDLSRLPLAEVAEKYFGWKAANISQATVEQEQRMFKKVLQFFNGSRPVRCICLLGPKSVPLRNSFWYKMPTAPRDRLL